jgi:hypothetical protein
MRNDQPSFTPDQILGLLDRMIKQGFWGEISLQFQSGRVLTIKRSETLKSFRKDGTTPLNHEPPNSY